MCARPVLTVQREAALGARQPPASGHSHVSSWLHCDVANRAAGFGGGASLCACDAACGAHHQRQRSACGSLHMSSPWSAALNGLNVRRSLLPTPCRSLKAGSTSQSNMYLLSNLVPVLHLTSIAPAYAHGRLRFLSEVPSSVCRVTYGQTPGFRALPMLGNLPAKFANWLVLASEIVPNIQDMHKASGMQTSYEVGDLPRL